MSPKAELQDPVMLRQFFRTAMFIEDDASVEEVAEALGHLPQEVKPMLDTMRAAFERANRPGGVAVTPCELILLDMITNGPEMMQTMRREKLAQVFSRNEVQRLLDTRTRLFHKGLIGHDFRAMPADK